MNETSQPQILDSSHLQPASLQERLTSAKAILAYGIKAGLLALTFHSLETQAQIHSVGAGTLKPTTAQELQTHPLAISHQIFNGKAVSQVWVNQDVKLGNDASLNFTLGQSQDISTGQASVVWNPNGDKSLTVVPYSARPNPSRHNYYLWRRCNKRSFT